MPPRKKGKANAQVASTPVADHDAMVIDTPPAQHQHPPTKSGPNILKDPWTDEQETSLFKGIIRWKPAGMHKHFRMIALSEHLRNHGYDPAIEKHTLIPGIWEKLRTLYNLEVIDERENAFDYEDGEDQYLEFKLPEDYKESMFMRGKRNSTTASEAPSSPPRINRSPSLPPAKKRKRGDTVTQQNRASTVDDTDEPRTSPTNSPAPKAKRAGRSAHRLIGRVKAESTSRAPSKDTTMDEDDKEDGAEEGNDEEAEEEPELPLPKPSKAKAKIDTPSKPQGPSRKSKRKK
ncbi:chromatin modification-related protein EAF7-domain-containing protein [Amylocarpus encephaloides]|uniref:Chromatin modification-related protein EAF7-domain-containing protein n=1 Tax=Amylocarpus encephaloides TaxID=45428 RepID=A0A9P7YSJ1_9HELO|nr:chromatin modification-related protein EAF7-domain-containing protein [Amylocarpus encephaloides]